jgi:biopolymer transport protein ExbD
MREDSKDFRLINAKPRSKKLIPRIDLAAMVSVSFLLIIFFMVTKELSKPNMMDLGMPEHCGGEGGCGGGCGLREQRVITLLLDDNNKVISYRGILEAPDDAPKRLNYGKDGVRKELIAMNKQVKEYMSTRNYRRNDGAIVIIKPSKKCSYGNLVDILDEMAITQIPTYAIINDYTPEESKLLASK